MAGEIVGNTVLLGGVVMTGWGILQLLEMVSVFEDAKLDIYFGIGLIVVGVVDLIIARLFMSGKIRSLPRIDDPRDKAYQEAKAKQDTSDQKGRGK